MAHGWLGIMVQKDLERMNEMNGFPRCTRSPLMSFCVGVKGYLLGLTTKAMTVQRVCRWDTWIQRAMHGFHDDNQILCTLYNMKLIPPHFFFISLRFQRPTKTKRGGERDP